MESFVARPVPCAKILPALASCLAFGVTTVIIENDLDPVTRVLFGKMKKSDVPSNLKVGLKFSPPVSKRVGLLADAFCLPLLSYNDISLHPETSAPAPVLVVPASALSQIVLFWKTHPGAGGVLLPSVKNSVSSRSTPVIVHRAVVPLKVPV